MFARKESAREVVLKILQVLLEIVFLPLKEGSWICKLQNSGQQKIPEEAVNRCPKWKTNTV